MGLLENLKSRYELHRLQQRYTRRDKRTTFASNAVYVDGEYIYASSQPSALNPGEGAPRSPSVRQQQFSFMPNNNETGAGSASPSPSNTGSGRSGFSFGSGSGEASPRSEGTRTSGGEGGAWDKLN